MTADQAFAFAWAKAQGVAQHHDDPIVGVQMTVNVLSDSVIAAVIGGLPISASKPVAGAEVPAYRFSGNCHHSDKKCYVLQTKGDRHYQGTTFWAPASTASAN